MGDRRLYQPAGFCVVGLSKHEEVWHLRGRFIAGAIKSKYSQDYHLRVVPDSRWEDVDGIVLLMDKVYESESVRWRSRRHTYGSGKWYVSRSTDGPREYGTDTRIRFEDVRVIHQATVNPPP